MKKYFIKGSKEDLWDAIEFDGPEFYNSKKAALKSMELVGEEDYDSKGCKIGVIQILSKQYKVKKGKYDGKF